MKMLVTGKRNFVVLDNLDPNTKYRVKIRTVTEDGDKSKFTPYLIFTTQTESLPTPTDVSIRRLSARSLEVSWSTMKHPNLLGYEIQYIENEKRYTLRWKSVKIYHHGQVVLEHLDPDTQYLVRIRAEGKDGSFGEFSDEVLTDKLDATTVTMGCQTSLFGCCPDDRTAALGPNGQGCPYQCRCHHLGSLGDQCDPTTHQCRCKPGVGGLRCDRCQPGYWGLPRIADGGTGCIPCDCNEAGSVREDCEQITGRCTCKPQLVGQKCDICPNGQRIGPDGCSDTPNGVLMDLDYRHPKKTLQKKRTPSSKRSKKRDSSELSKKERRRLNRRRKHKRRLI